MCDIFDWEICFKTCYSTANLKRKKSSWLSDLFEQKSQSVMWLRDTKNHLYAKYREDCEGDGQYLKQSFVKA